MAPTTPFIARIALIYRIWFLYLEPLAALGGTYLSIFNPDRFLSGTLPLPTYLSIASSPNGSVPITPLLELLLTNIGALYLLFAINEGIVLRLTKEKSVWFGVMGAMLASDVGHIYAVYAIAPERMWALASWNGDEWVNVGMLVFGAVLRAAFLMGVGRP
jgi:hypothetical protein